jgi:hypothetical protein
MVMREPRDLAAFYAERENYVHPAEWYEVDDRWALAVSVTGDGNLVVLFHDDEADAFDWARCWDCPPDHERLGQLPKEYALRCDAVRSNGGLCRARPVKGQRRCSHHQDQP